MTKLLLTGIAALFLATGPTPAPAQDCDYNSPSYFKCKEKPGKAHTMAQSLLGPAHAQRNPDGLVRAVLQTVAERSKLQWRLRKSHVTATVCEIAS